MTDERTSVFYSARWAKYLSIEYGICARCDRLVFVPLVRGHIVRWRHNRGRWEFVGHRPKPVPNDMLDNAEV